MKDATFMDYCIKCYERIVMKISGGFYFTKSAKQSTEMSLKLACERSLTLSTEYFWKMCTERKFVNHLPAHRCAESRRCANSGVRGLIRDANVALQRRMKVRDGSASSPEQKINVLRGARAAAGHFWDPHQRTRHTRPSAARFSSASFSALRSDTRLAPLRSLGLR